MEVAKMVSFVIVGLVISVLTVVLCARIFERFFGGL